MVSNAAPARTTVGAHGDDQSVNPETNATTRYANRVGVKPYSNLSSRSTSSGTRAAT
jgi:hypothetical protein